MKFHQYFKYLQRDIPAGIVVFLVALPLCLGIALASGAPLFSGIISGIVGGVVVSLISGSQTAVSGPAAGLTVIVFNAIENLGGFESFLVAVVLAGIIQIVLGVLKAGIIGLYFPTSVIRGMLAAIGLILILKQIPHFLGVDTDAFGEMEFIQPDGRNTFSEIVYAISHVNPGALIIGIVSLLIIVVVDSPRFKNVQWLHKLPGALIAVIFGVLTKLLFDFLGHSELIITTSHLVDIPIISDQGSLDRAMSFPDFSILSSGSVYIAAFTIAIVASLETLLSIEAVDKIDPEKRHSPKNRELIAQGVGNTLSGLIGGLPMTAVIVRSSANVDASGKTKLSAFFHGLFLVGAIYFIPNVLNQIPLASLAAVLLVVGYKLAKPKLFRRLISLGFSQWFPFIVTIVVVLFTDLLIGIVTGLVVAVFFILKSNYRRPFFYLRDIHEGTGRHNITIRLSEHVTFLNKASLQLTLDEIPDGSKVLIDGSNTEDIDFDSYEVLETFKESANNRHIDVELKEIPDFSRA